jgi:catalase
LPKDSKTSTQYRLPSLTDKGGLVRLAMIGAAVASIAGCFAHVAGWLSPRSLTQARLIDTFEQVNGIYSGFRRNHAKGVCIAGYFESNGQGARLSKAVVFQPGRVPVIGRFVRSVLIPCSSSLEGPSLGKFEGLAQAGRGL